MALKSKNLDEVREDLPVDEVTREDVARINLNVPLSIKRKWKIASATTGKSLTDMICEAMDKYLKEPR